MTSSREIIFQVSLKRIHSVVIVPSSDDRGRLPNVQYSHESAIKKERRSGRAGVKNIQDRLSG